MIDTIENQSVPTWLELGIWIARWIGLAICAAVGTLAALMISWMWFAL